MFLCFTVDKRVICKLCIIARIWKPLPEKFLDLCCEMDICSDVM